MEYLKNAKELSDILHLFLKLVRREHYLDELSFSEVMVCGIISDAKNNPKDSLIQVKELSSRLNMSRPALNTVLNKLEDRNLIERYRIKGDRKSVYVKLTAKSHDIFEHEQDKMIQYFNKIVSELGDDVAYLIELLNKLYLIMEREMENVKVKEDR